MKDQEITSVVVAQFAKKSFAQMTVEMLENEGIKAQIVGSGDTGLKYYIGDASTSANFEVIVHPDFSDKAIELVDSMHNYIAGNEDEKVSETITNAGFWLELVKIDSEMVADTIDEILEDQGIPAHIEEIDSDEFAYIVKVPESRLEDAKTVLDQMEKGMYSDE